MTYAQLSPTQKKQAEQLVFAHMLKVGLANTSDPRLVANRPARQQMKALAKKLVSRYKFMLKDGALSLDILSHTS